MLNAYEWLYRFSQIFPFFEIYYTVAYVLRFFKKQFSNKKPFDLEDLRESEYNILVFAQRKHFLKKLTYCYKVEWSERNLQYLH